MTASPLAEQWLGWVQGKLLSPRIPIPPKWYRKALLGPDLRVRVFETLFIVN
jgi:hypothetical protein